MYAKEKEEDDILIKYGVSAKERHDRYADVRLLVCHPDVHVLGCGSGAYI
jgi:hypothetical protein